MSFSYRVEMAGKAPDFPSRPYFDSRGQSFKKMAQLEVILQSLSSNQNHFNSLEIFLLG